MRRAEAAEQKAAELEQENTGLRDILQFYADPETYFGIAFIPDKPCGEFWEDFDDDLVAPDGQPYSKPGKRARQALSAPSELAKARDAVVEAAMNDWMPARFDEEMTLIEITAWEWAVGQADRRKSQIRLLLAGKADADSKLLEKCQAVAKLREGKEEGDATN